MPDDLAPVALFAYRRPDHLGRTIDALRGCAGAERTALTVFSDGPKGADDDALVAEVRTMLTRVEGFASVRVIERPANIGLARNVIAGVTQMLDENPSVIVLEDDMVVSGDFLTYMNEALVMYADESRVASIHGYIYPTQERLPDYFFLRGADCWGWATWGRGWSLFNPDGAALLKGLEDTNATEAFDFGGAFGYTQMLRDQVAGRVDSWAVRWYASAFLAGAFTLYPGASLVENIGLDGSGTNSLDGRGLATSARGMRPLVPIPVEQSAAIRAIVARALLKQKPEHAKWWRRAVERVWR
ncbi:MAG: glycosyltransferase family 2 protein [bacterium]|nr:glycosyltransferase family 2 protein [bacterium]